MGPTFFKCFLFNIRSTDRRIDFLVKVGARMVGAESASLIRESGVEAHSLTEITHSPGTEFSIYEWGQNVWWGALPSCWLRISVRARLRQSLRLVLSIAYT